MAAGCGDSGGKRGAVEVTAVVGEVGRSPGQFTFPRAIDADGKELWVIDKAARVQRMDPATGRASALWKMPEWEHGKPTGVTVAPPLPMAAAGGHTDPYLLYVPDTHYYRVMVYRPPAALGQEPELVAKVGEFGRGPGQFIYLTDIAVLTGADGRTVERIYVSEYGGNDRITVFDADLKCLFAIGKFGDSESAESVEFSRPQSMQIDSARRELIVTDACNHRVGVFTLDGKLVRWIGSPSTSGDAPDAFSYPYGLLLLGDGTALVTEIGNHRVHHVDYVEGKSLGNYGGPGRKKGQFTTPWGVTMIGDTVYVLDSGNERIQAFKKPRPVRG
jgi:DNA-binding beta-propeller fold protein YncE